MRRNRDRYDHYRDVTAKFDSVSNACRGGGHQIRKGDIIGYNPSVRPAKTMCAACWQAWINENLEADYLEANPSACPW